MSVIRERLYAYPVYLIFNVLNMMAQEKVAWS